MFSAPSLLLANESVDIIAAIRQNDTLGHICLAFLLMLSVYSFTIIFAKFTSLSRASKQTNAFRRLVDQDGSWDSLFVAAKKYPESPVARLLKETYVECRLENWFAGPKGEIPVESRLEIARHTIENILMKTISSEEGRLMQKVPTLSTITTLAPFIGLIGTVWGVLSAFQGLGRAGGASLATLAPGISTALVTTVFGLFCAVPALIAYNYFVAEVGKLSSSMEVFSHDLENAVRKQILNVGGK
ncbi:protein TolQ [soil metagenome]